VHFSILAHGPGEALGGGAAFMTRCWPVSGLDAKAKGFDADLGNMQGTLRAAQNAR